MVSSSYKHLRVEEVKTHIEAVSTLHPDAANSLLTSLKITREPFTYDNLRDAIRSVEPLFGRDDPNFSNLRGSILTRFQ